MDLVHDRSVGIDISKRGAKVCVRVPGTRPGTYSNTVTTWGATTSEVLRLCEFLEEQHITVVTMESTSDYWKPFYYLMEDSLPVMLVGQGTATSNVPSAPQPSPSPDPKQSTSGRNTGASNPDAGP